MTMIDDLDFIHESGRKYLLQLAQELAFGSVVLFAGAGLSFNAVARDGGRNRMPSWRELADKLRERLDEDLQNNADPLKIADYFETKFGRAALNEAVRDAIQDLEHEPGRIHQCITRLNFEEIITTNYDTLVERTFVAQFVEPQIVVDGHDLVRQRRPPRIIKMHGCLRLNSSGIVVTGSDFLSYAEKHPWVQIFLTQSFIQSTVLFIGFGLNDPAFQAINERVLSMLGRDKSRLAFSLQHGASKTETEYWKKRQVQIIDVSPGSPKENEDRLHRVLHALIEFQRAQTRWPQRRGRGALFAQPVSSNAAMRCSDSVEAMIRETSTLFDSLLDEERFAAFRISAVGKMLEECVRRASVRHRMVGVANILGELATWLREICRLEDIDSPGLLLQPLEWEPIRNLLDLLIDSGLKKIDQRTDSDLLPNFKVLVAILALKLAIIAPRLALMAKSEEERCPISSRRLAIRRFEKALGLLDLDCLGTQDMQVRSRLIALLCFFGPLRMSSDLVSAWTYDGGQGETWTSGEGQQVTPEEYRLLPLSFYGILQQRPHLYQKAAESLWSRQIFMESPVRGWRIESAFRYRYLRQGARQLEDWSGVRLQVERLARVLGQLELDPGLPDNPDNSDPGEELLAVLLEVNRGWMFDCSSPGDLSQAWDAAAVKCEKGRAAEVPWEALIILTLPIEGYRLFKRWQGLLLEAWRAGQLDTQFLAEHLARRIGDGTFERLASNPVSSRVETPMGRYEWGMAHMVRWLAGRIPYEPQNSEILDTLERVLLRPPKEGFPSPFANWLCQTPYPEVRSSLLEALATLHCFAPVSVNAVIRIWISARLRQSPQSSSLQLSVLNPSPLALSVEPHEIRILLAHAQAPRTEGTDFRNDFLKWLVGWTELEIFDSLTLTSLARQILEILAGGEETRNVDWLRLAAEVRGHGRLCKIVEEMLSRERTNTPILFRHIETRLFSLSDDRYKAQRQDKGAILKFLVPFVEDFDDEMSRFVGVSFESELISPESRNDAVTLLAGLLKRAPKEVMERYEETWWRALSRLLLQGAIGRGLFADQIALLLPEVRQALQNSLVFQLERNGAPKPSEITEDIIAQIEEKIRLSGDNLFSDLEEEIVGSIQSQEEARSFYSLQAVLRLSRDLPGFMARNQVRIHRTLTLVEKRGYRKPSRFAELLDELRKIEENQTGASSPLKHA